MTNRWTVDWSNAPKVNYCRTSAVEILGTHRLRYEFDNGVIRDCNTIRPAADEAAEWLAERAQRGAVVMAAEDQDAAQ